MPIEIATEIQILDQEQFHALDKRVMAIVFAVHNSFGRLMDEGPYKRAIAVRCAEAGITPVEREVCIRLTHETFHKDYFMDLLIGHGLMLEAKTVETLLPVHRAQCLNYLMMTGMKHSRLVNLRPDRVEYEFVSTTLDDQERRRFLVSDSNWYEPNSASAIFKRKFIDLLQDWGAFLEINLYREAMRHLLNGSSAGSQEVEILDGGNVLGCQRVGLLTEDTAFSCTALTKALDQFAEHQRRWLAHTRLRFIQWVNLNHAHIEFRTLSR